MPSQAELQYTVKMVDGMSATLRQIQQSLGGMGNAAEQAKNKLATLGEIAESVGEAVGGFFASFELASKALEAADEVNGAFARIGKAALMTKDQITEFGESIEEALSKSGGRVSESSLLGIAEAAAKVGIAGKDLSEFSEDIVKLGLAAGGAGDMFATAIGQILNVTEDSTEHFSDYANELSLVAKATGVATDSLVLHARALASATAASQLTKEQITGLAVITDSLPGRFNAAAGAIQNIFASISSDSVGAREGIRQLSLATGQTEASLRSLAQTNPVALFERILDHVHDLNGQRLAQGNFLAEFNIQGGEAERVMDQLSSKGKQLAQVIDMQDRAKGNTDALDANQAPITFANSLTALQNAVDGVSASFGKLISPVAISFMQDLTAAINAVNTGFNAMPPLLQGATAYLIIFAGAAAGLVKTFGILKGIGGGLMELLGIEKAAEGAAEVAEVGAAAEGAGIATATFASKFAGLRAEMQASEGIMTRLGTIGASMAANWLPWSIVAVDIVGSLKAIYDYGEKLGAARDAGHSWADIADATAITIDRAVGDKVGVQQHTDRLRNSMQGQKDTGTGAFSAEAITNNWSASTPDSADRAADRARRDRERTESSEKQRQREEDASHSLSATDTQAIQPALQINAATQALQRYQDALAKIMSMTSDQRATAIPGGITDADIARLQEEVILEQRKADPIANQIRLGALAMDQVKATTQDLKDQVAARDAINAAIEKDASVANDPEKIKAISAQVYEKSLISANNAIQDQNRSLDEQIAKLVAVGTAAKNDLEIAIQRAAFDREHGAGSYDRGGMETKQRAVDTLQGGQAVINQYLPQVSAAKNLLDAQNQINASQQAGLITEQEAVSARQKLTADTLASVSPLDAIVKNSQRELEYAQVMGPTRDSEIEALKTINDLKDKGVVFTQKDEAALKSALTTLNTDMAQLNKEQNSGFNGFVNKVGTIQDNISTLQSSFADGLSNGIDAALTRNRNAFAAAGKAFGEQALKMGTNMVLAEVFKSTGLAGPDKALSDKIAKDQDAVHRIASAQVSINSANVTINNAGAAAVAAGVGTNTTNPDAGSNGVAPGNGSINTNAENANNLVGKIGPAGTAGGSFGPGGGVGPSEGSGLSIGAGGFGLGAGGSPISAQVQAAQNALAAGGSGRDFYSAARMHETRDQNIPNSEGGNAGGYYQFMAGTWAGIRRQHPELGLPETALSASKEQQTAAYREFTKGNVEDLARTGVPINDKNVFMSSFLGSKGASKFIGNMGTNPNAGAASDFPKEAASNRTVFFNKDGSQKSYQQVYGNMTGTFGSTNTTGFGPNQAAQTVASNPVTASSLATSGPSNWQAYLASHAAPGIDTKDLNPEFGKHLAEGMQAAEASGITPKVQSGYRSYDQQASLYSDFINHRNGQGIAAPPGHSDHESGMAADVTSRNPADMARMRAIIAGKGGLNNSVKGDPDHFQWTGSAASKGKPPIDVQPMQKNIDQAAKSLGDFEKATTSTAKAVPMLNPAAAATPTTAGTTPTINPVNDNTPTSSTSDSGIGGQLAGGLGSIAGKIPGAAPYMQGFNLLKSLFSGGGGSGGAGGGLGGIAGGLFGGVASPGAGVADAAGGLGGGGGGLFSSLFSLFGLLHSGGVVGPGMTTTFRAVNPAIFANAQRFHDGLGDDEFPAILQKGERVLTASQDSRNSNAMGRLANAVANTSTAAGTERPTIPGVNNNISMVVNTPDAPSFRRSSSQVLAATHAAMSRAGGKNN
jgi:hypothetical protein